MEWFKNLKKWQKIALVLGGLVLIGLLMSVGVDSIELND